MITEQPFKLSDHLRDEECYSKRELAAELNLSPQQTMIYLRKAVKQGLVQNIYKTRGQKKLYAPMVVEGLVKAFNDGRLGKPRKKRHTEFKSAKTVIMVPVFDPVVYGLLKVQFRDDEGIQDYLSKQLTSVVMPKLQRLKALEDEFEKERGLLFSVT